MQDPTPRSRLETALANAKRFFENYPSEPEIQERRQRDCFLFVKRVFFKNVAPNKDRILQISADQSAQENWFAQYSHEDQLADQGLLNRLKDAINNLPLAYNLIFIQSAIKPLNLPLDVQIDFKKKLKSSDEKEKYKEEVGRIKRRFNRCYDKKKLKEKIFADRVGFIKKDKDIEQRGKGRYPNAIRGSEFITRLPDTEIYFGKASKTLTSLLELKIHTTICLLQDRDFKRFYKDKEPKKKKSIGEGTVYAITLDPDIFDDQEFTVYQFPIQDGNAAALQAEDYQEIFKLLEQALKKTRIYIHCEEGKGRTGIFIFTILLMQNQYQRFIDIFYTEKAEDLDEKRVLKKIGELLEEIRQLSPGMIASPAQLWQACAELLPKYFIPETLKKVPLEFSYDPKIFKPAQAQAGMVIPKSKQLPSIFSQIEGSCKILYELQADIFNRFRETKKSNLDDSQWQLMANDQVIKSTRIPPVLACVLELIEESKLSGSLTVEGGEDRWRLTAETQDRALNTLSKIHHLLEQKSCPEASALTRRYQERISDCLAKAIESGAVFETTLKI